MPAPLNAHWQPMADGTFESQDLFAFLRAAHNSLSPGSFSAELGRHLTAEKIEKKTLPLRLEEFTELHTTRRIDGIMPLDIPAVCDVTRLAGELIEQVALLDLDLPTARDPFCKEFGLVILAFLHQRQFALNYGLFTDLRLECPHSEGGGPRRPTLTLMGYLPLGGRVAIFTSPLLATKWTEDIPAEAVENCSKLGTRRKEGTLKLVKS